MLNIKELRIRQGITQLQLSEKMGITQATVACGNPVITIRAPISCQKLLGF